MKDDLHLEVGRQLFEAWKAAGHAVLLRPLGGAFQLKPGPSDGRHVDSLIFYVEPLKGRTIRITVEEIEDADVHA